MAVGRVGSAFGAGGEVLKEDSEPSEDQAPQSSLRKTEDPKLSDLFPFSRRNQPMALCSVRSVNNQSNTSKGHEASRDHGCERIMPSSANLYASEPLGPCG